MFVAKTFKIVWGRLKEYYCTELSCTICTIFSVYTFHLSNFFLENKLKKIIKAELIWDSDTRRMHRIAWEETLYHAWVVKDRTRDTYPFEITLCVTCITNLLSTEVKNSRVISMEISVFGRFFDQKSQMQRVEF